VWQEGFGQLKNSMVSLGIGPTTFQLVVQCLIQLLYCMPQQIIMTAVNAVWISHIITVNNIMEEPNAST
jgi:hypothetical protein